MNAIPTVTKNLLIINVLVFLATIVAQSYGLDLARYLGLHFFLADNFNIAQLITYMFMHGGFTHLFFNMFALWMFGRILEQVWGPKRFLFYYLASAQDLYRKSFNMYITKWCFLHTPASTRAILSFRWENIST